jgi:FkbM family methyltransferase|tara:strand:+ start:69 stop:710 length:642 start_codon:yes stop_codon:yes gene_type:complete
MRSTKIVSIKNIPMVIFDSPECISDDIVKYNNFWEFKLFDRWKDNFPKEGLMLDIGANIGSHCVQFKYHCPNLEIYAFEPFKENFDVLIQNTKQYKDVKCFNVGVGSRTSIVHFNDGHAQNSGVVRVVRDSNNPNIVLSLDNLILPKVSFIKIDVEGHELACMQGMTHLLKKDKPLIWLEENNTGNQRVIPYLENLGYKILEEEKLTNDYLMI